MKTLEVRCCCIPKKLLGWLDVPDHIKDGDNIQFSILPQLPPTGLFGLDKPDSVSFQQVTLTASEYWEKLDENNSRGYLALKSNETPLENLRTLSGFRENK